MRIEKPTTNDRFYVRKGTSLGRCDLTAAREYHIDVFNLTGEYYFCYKFYEEISFQEKMCSDCISIIGTGTGIENYS